MALTSCEECGKQVSDKAPACPHCGAPRVLATAATEGAGSAKTTGNAAAPAKKPSSAPMWLQVVIGLAGAYMLFSCIGGSGSSSKSSSAAPAAFDWNDALTMCQFALKRVSRDPEKADIPYVPNQGSGDEFYYAWGASTKMARMRNGLGLEVGVSASCTVSRSQRRITSLTLDGKTIL